MPGFTRGLSFVGPYAFVGLSQVRETLFEGIPLKAEGVERSCGVWVIDLADRHHGGVPALRGQRARSCSRCSRSPGSAIPEIVEPGADVLDASFVLPDAALADVPRRRNKLDSGVVNFGERIRHTPR